MHRQKFRKAGTGNNITHSQEGLAEFCPPCERKNEFIELPLSVSDATKFNSTVLRILLVKFKDIVQPTHNMASRRQSFTTIGKPSIQSSIDNIEDQDSQDEVSYEQIESNVIDIFNKRNMFHNISTGDVLWILNRLDNMDRTNEESFFLFVVKFIYSIRMYEYYNDVFKFDYKQLAEKELEGTVVYSHPIAEIKDKNQYSQLLAGHLFNKNLVSFIPESTKEKVISDGRILWDNVKSGLLETGNTKMVDF